MRICLYARVSKALEQNPENQLIALREWSVRANATVVGEFVDEVSSKDTRPQKQQVLGMLRTHQADGVAFYSLDRWGRNMSEIVLELEEFSQSGWVMLALKEQLDLSTASGRMFAHILGAMANFERDRIKERTLLGLARAKAQGKKLGRPRKKTPPANPTTFSEEKTVL
jgi:DNA invertase Pin-like site-specific DNA recombinase